MRPLLAAELLKLRTTRTFVALTSIAIGTSLLITTLVSLLSEPTEESVLTDVFTADTSSLFILVLAVIGISGEWRHHTITSSLLAAPHRIRFLAAKTIAFAAAGVLLSLLISIAIGSVGFAILSARDLPTPPLGDVVEQFGRNALLAALLGAFGVGIGAIVRNQVVAIVGVLVVSFFVEPVLLQLVEEVGRYGPFVVLPTAASGVPPDQSGLGDADLPSAAAAIGLMLAWIAAAFAAGAALLKLRDLE